MNIHDAFLRQFPSRESFLGGNPRDLNALLNTQTSLAQKVGRFSNTFCDFDWSLCSSMCFSGARLKTIISKIMYKSMNINYTLWIDISDRYICFKQLISRYFSNLVQHFGRVSTSGTQFHFLMLLFFQYHFENTVEKNNLNRSDVAEWTNFEEEELIQKVSMLYKRQ